MRRRRGSAGDQLHSNSANSLTPLKRVAVSNRDLKTAPTKYTLADGRTTDTLPQLGFLIIDDIVLHEADTSAMGNTDSGCHFLKVILDWENSLMALKNPSLEICRREKLLEGAQPVLSTFSHVILDVHQNQILLTLELLKSNQSKVSKVNKKSKLLCMGRVTKALTVTELRKKKHVSIKFDLKGKKKTIAHATAYISFQEKKHKYRKLESLLFHDAQSQFLPALLDALDPLYVNGSLDCKFPASLSTIFYNNDEMWPLLEIIIKKEINTKDASIFLRENSLGTHLLSEFLLLDGTTFLHKILNKVRKLVLKQGCSTPLSLTDNITKSRKSKGARNLITQILRSILDHIENDSELLPLMTRKLCQIANSEARSRGGHTNNTLSAILFLRYISPAIVSPERIGFEKITNLEVHKPLIIVAKVLLQLGNCALFDPCDTLADYNELIAEYIPVILKFYAKILQTQIKEELCTILSEVTEETYTVVLTTMKTHQREIETALTKDKKHLRYSAFPPKRMPNQSQPSSSPIPSSDSRRVSSGLWMVPSELEAPHVSVVGILFCEVVEKSGMDTPRRGRDRMSERRSASSWAVLGGGSSTLATSPPAEISVDEKDDFRDVDEKDDDPLDGSEYNSSHEIEESVSVPITEFDDQNGVVQEDILSDLENDSEDELNLKPEDDL